MKKLFGNTKLIKQNKKLVYWEEQDANPDEKEYAIIVKYTFIKTIETDKIKQVTVHAKNSEDAKELARQEIWDKIDPDNEDIDIHEVNVISINKEVYTDKKTLNMFDNAQNKKA